MGNGKKELNPADKFRKEERKKELKKNKKVKEEARKFQELLSNPQKIKEEIQKLEIASAENRLDKGIKDKLKEMNSILNVAEMRASADTKVNTKVEKESTHPSFSQKDQIPVVNPFYHPVYNPSGAAPLGYPQSGFPGKMPQPPPPPGLPGPTPTTSSSSVHPSYDPANYQPTNQINQYASHPYSVPAQYPNQAIGNPNNVFPPTARLAIGGTNGIPLPPPRPAHPLAQTTIHSQQQKQQQQIQQIHQQQQQNKPQKRVPTASYDPLDPADRGYNNMRDNLNRTAVKPIPSNPFGNEKLVKDQIESGNKYFSELSSKEDVYKLKSGMYIQIIQSSSDPNAVSPNEGDACLVCYKGTFINGVKFDSGTTTLAPNQVIKGWTEAMQLMVEGDKWKLHIPFALAYGESGSPPKIPGYSTLVFDIELLKVNTGGKSKKIARDAFTNAQIISTTTTTTATATTAATIIDNQNHMLYPSNNTVKLNDQAPLQIPSMAAGSNSVEKSTTQNNFIPQNFSLSNLEEIMKRRNMINQEATELGPAVVNHNNADTHSDLSSSYSSSENQSNSVGSFYTGSSNTLSHGYGSLPGPASSITAKNIGPKVVKIESEMKSLIPASVRVKRPASVAVENPGQPKTSKYNNPGQTDLNVLYNTTTASKNSTEKSEVVSNNVDDAYSDFMNEINMLGSIE